MARPFSLPTYGARRDGGARQHLLGPRHQPLVRPRHLLCGQGGRGDGKRGRSPRERDAGLVRVRRLARCRRHRHAGAAARLGPSPLPSVARYRQLEESASFCERDLGRRALLGLAFGGTRSGRCACGFHQRKPSPPAGRLPPWPRDPRGREGQAHQAVGCHRRTGHDAGIWWSPQTPAQTEGLSPQPPFGLSFRRRGPRYGFDEPGSCSLSAPRTTAAASSSNGVASAWRSRLWPPQPAPVGRDRPPGRREAGTDAEQYVGVLDGPSWARARSITESCWPK